MFIKLNFLQGRLNGLKLNQKIIITNVRQTSKIPEKTFSYATRNNDGIPLIKIKLNFFKNTFFPSAVIEWNKLGPTIRNVESFGIFKSNILKSIRIY